MFVNTLSTRFSPGYDRMGDVLSLLPERTRFAVCRALLARPVESGRRTRMRTHPVARRKKANSVSTADTPSSTQAPTLANYDQATLCSPSEVIQLLTSTWGDEMDALVVKFHLLDTYIDLQRSMPTGVCDTEWMNMLQTGAIHQNIEALFSVMADAKDCLLAKLATCS